MKAPTERDLLNKIWHIIQQQVEEEILLSSDVQDEIERHIESHTAAHTAELREKVKELEASIKEAIDILESQLFNEYKVSSAHEELCNALKKVES